MCLPALARENQEALIHPGCSSDLSRLDYYIFGQLKKSLMGQLFHSYDDGKVAVLKWFHDQAASFLANRIRNLPKQRDACLNAMVDFLYQTLYKFEILINISNLYLVGTGERTLRTTFISLIRPVLEFGIPIYSCASDTNRNKLERAQLCAARIITGLRYSCQIDIVLFESNLPSSQKEDYKALQDGSRGDKGISGSVVYIHTPSGVLEFKIKNPNYCSVFRSELIAISGLQCAAQLEDRFQEIWILTDSRASIQHLANWGDIGDQTSLDILSLLHDLSSGHSIHFQWIPSHVGIEGNERADFLDGTAAVEGVGSRGNLTFSEISTISKLELNRKIKTPPSHAWYFAKCPGESFRLSSRPLQFTSSRFLSGHTRALRFSNGQKTFPKCHWCSSGEALPNHILLCLGFKKDEVLCNPLLFLDFLQIFGFMGIV
ncbi:putative RNA-directed DNA polymerase from transposon BS [Trichonephila clavipes]|nr:putative RNA-directed DNA polymerase from transposon BS [Trichonephila clavipes]